MLKASRSDRPPAAKKIIRKSSNHLKKPKNFKIGNTKKYILYLIIFILFVFFSFIFFAPMFINLKIWKPEIISMLEENTGKTASIKGDIELKIYPSPQIKIFDITLKDEKSGIINNFFKSSSVVAKLSFLPLLKGNIVIDGITFDNLTVNLLSNSGQKPNWVFIKNIKEDDKIDDSFNEKYSKYNQIKYPNIKISEFSIIRGTIIYNNTSKVDLENVVISTNENINLINGDIYLNNNKFLFNSSYSPNLNVKDSWNTQVSLSNNEVNLNADLEVLYAQNFPQLTGDLELNYKDLEEVLGNISFKYLSLFNNKTKIKGDLSLNFKDKNLYYSIFNISAFIGSLTLTGAVSGNNGIRPNIEMAFSSNNLDLDKYIKKIININQKYNDISELSPSEEGDYWDLHSAKFLLSVGTSKLLNYPIRNFVIEINKEDKIYSLNSGKAIFPGNTNIEFNGSFKNKFSIFEGSGTLTSDNIRDFSKWLSIDLDNMSQARLRKTSLNSNIVFRKGGATFAGIKGKLDSSNINGEIILRFEDINSLHANLSIDKINLDSYINNNSKDNRSININEFKFFHFDVLNTDLKIGQLLFFKNKYNNVSFNNFYKNNILTIDKLYISDFAGGNLNLNGVINYKKKYPEYDLVININHSDFSKFNDFFKIPNVFKELITGEGTLKINAEGKSNSFNSNILFESTNARINYDGDIKLNNFYIKDYEGDISLSVDNLNSIIDLGSDGATIYTSKVLKNNNILKLKDITIDNLNYKYTGDIELNYEENNTYDINVDIKSDFLTTNNIKNIYNYFYKDLDASITGNLNLYSDLFIINDFKIYNLGLVFDFDADKILLKKLKGQLFDGILNAEFKILNNELHEYSGKISFNKLDTSQLFNNYFSYDKFISEVSSEVIVSGQGKNFDEFFTTMLGEGELKFKRNSIKGFDINKIYKLNDIEGNKNLINYMYEAFNTKEEKKLNNFNVKYTYKNNNLFLEKTEINIDDYSLGIEGQINFQSKDYNLLSTFVINEDLNNVLSLNLVRSNNIINNKAKSNYSQTDHSAENNVIKETPKRDNNEVREIIEDNNNFDDILDDLSQESEDGLDEGKSILPADENEIFPDIKEANTVINKEVFKFKLPLFFKEIENPIIINYFKPKLLINNIIKPKLPSQEDILDDLLDSVLSPDN